MIRRGRLMLRTRRLQIGFLVLLGLCSAQLAWWLVDQVDYTAEVQTRLTRTYQSDARVAQDLLRSGMAWPAIVRNYPELVRGADTMSVVVSPRVLAQLEAQRFHRINRYGWEGAFFLAVLLGAMAVVYRALREAASLHRRQELFLAAVSHELRSPLASIRLSIETLALRDATPSRRAELMQRVLDDMERLQRTIENLLDTSRLSAADVRTVPERLDLRREAASALEELQGQAEASGVTISSSVPEGLSVVADPGGMRTILRNLLHNAVKASGEGGHVVLRGTAANGHVRIEVEDDGVGFAEAEAGRLFEKFYRVEAEGRERLRGTGLGLYLVRRSAELDGGVATARSAGPGRGATFTVTWPKPEGSA